MRKHKTVAEWMKVGSWHFGPAAPNGSVPGTQQRFVTEYHVYSADYYGEGEKLYMHTRPFLHYVYGGRVCVSLLGGTSDGSPERIQKVADEAGIELSV